MNVIEQLNAQGCATYVLPDSLSTRVSDFIDKLDACCAKWFIDMVKKCHESESLTDRPGQGYESNTLKKQRIEWQKLSRAEQQHAIATFSPDSVNGRIAMTCCTTRRKISKQISTTCGDYLAFIVQCAKQGGNPMALADMTLSWTKEGFGMWANVVPNISFEIVEATRALLIANGMSARMHSHFPHLIYKHERSQRLAEHHDQFPPAELLNVLNTHYHLSVHEWVMKFGLQILGHLHGGHDNRSGATYIIGPMSPKILYLCLKDFKDRKVMDDTWWKMSSGPYFAKWISEICNLNTMLKKNNECQLSIIPIAPSVKDPFIAMWPVAFPHGSFSSEGRRISIAIPIDVKMKDISTDDGISAKDTIKWLQCMACIAHPDSSAIKLATALDHVTDVKKRKITFADGKTHKKPYIMKDLIAENGWFNNIAPHPNEVEKFAKSFE